MKLFSVFLIIIYTYVLQVHSMNNQNQEIRRSIPLDDPNICSFKPLYRPETKGEFIIGKVTGKHPYSTQLYLSHPPQEDQLLERSGGTYIFSCCSTKGTYLAALSVNYSQVTPHQITINPLNTIHVWNLNTKKLVFSLDTKQLNFILSPQENYIACDAADDQSVEIHSLATAQLYAKIAKQKGVVTSCPSKNDSFAFSPCERFFAYEENCKTSVVDLHNRTQPPLAFQGHSPIFTPLCVLFLKTNKESFFVELVKHQAQKVPGSNS